MPRLIFGYYWFALVGLVVLVSLMPRLIFDYCPLALLNLAVTPMLIMRSLFDCHLFVLSGSAKIL